MGVKKMKSIAMIAMLVLVTALVSGCEEQTLTVPGENQNQVDGDGSQEGDNEGPGDGHDHGDSDYAESHGPDDDEELLEPGLFNGSWRVALPEEDQPLVYFDIFHDQGESTATGNFLMGMAMGEMLDGTPGDLQEVSISGNEVTISWNPTTDAEEMYRLELVRESEDHFSGAFAAERNPQTEEVMMTRRVFQNDDDLDPFEE